MSQANLIVNGDFETGNLISWGSQNAAIDSTASHSGVYCARISGATGGLLYQIVPATPGASYELVASLAKASPGVGPYVYVFVSFYDNALVLTGVGLLAGIATRLPNGGANGWTVVYYTTTPAPPGTTQAYVVFQTLATPITVDLLVDDVALLPVGGAIPGPVGPQGPAGPTGTTGKTGASGDIGPQGAGGASGGAGNAGSTGPDGSTGTTGAPGPTGSSGAGGMSGTTGAAGPYGVALAYGSLYNGSGSFQTGDPVVDFVSAGPSFMTIPDYSANTITVQQDGVYKISASLDVSQDSDEQGGGGTVRILVNGSPLAPTLGTHPNDKNTETRIGATVLCACAAGDAISLGISYNPAGLYRNPSLSVLRIS